MAEFAKEDLDAIVSAIGFGIVNDFRSLQSAMGTLADQSAENNRILGDINSNLTSTDRTLERLEKDIYRQIDARQFTRVENEMEKRTKSSSRRADQILSQVQKSLSDLQKETTKGNNQTSSGGQSQEKKQPEISTDEEINQFLKDVESSPTGSLGGGGTSVIPAPSSGAGVGTAVGAIAVTAAVAGAGYMMMNQTSTPVGSLAPAEAPVPETPSIGVTENKGAATQAPTASTTGAISSATQTVTAVTTSMRRKALDKITNKLYDWVNKNTDKVMAIIGPRNVKVLGQLTGGTFTFSKYMTDNSWTGLGEQYVLGNSISPGQTKDQNAAYVAGVVVNLAILAYLACRDIYTRENYNDIKSGAVRNFDDLGSSEKFQYVKNAGGQIENYVNKLISETRVSTSSNFSIISSAAAAVPPSTETAQAPDLAPTVAPPASSSEDEPEEDQSGTGTQPQSGGAGGGGGGGGTAPAADIGGGNYQQAASPTQGFTGSQSGGTEQSDAEATGGDNVASFSMSDDVLTDISGGGSLDQLKAEISSGEGDYGAYNRGTAGDTPRSKRTIDIQNLTVGEIMQLQSQRKLFAVGKYQFIPETLAEAVSATGVDYGQRFDAATQEQLFPYLISEAKRPQLARYLSGKSNDEDAAINDLAHEFASIPMTSGRGAYDGDKAGNKASGGQRRVQKIRSILRGIRNSSRVSSNEETQQQSFVAAAEGAVITPLPKAPTDTINLAPSKFEMAGSSSDDEDEFTTSSNPIDARPKSYSANPMDEVKNKISSYMDYMEYHFGYLSQEFDLHTSGELTAEEAYKRAMNPLGR